MSVLQAQRLALLQRHVARVQARAEIFQQQSARLSHWRLLVFLLTTAVSLILLWQRGVWAWAGTLLLGGIPFTWLVRQHRCVESGLHRATLWQQIKQTHLARMALDWATIPETPTIFPDVDHPFARDLDIVGAYSLHRLLDTAVCQEGSARLQAWLLERMPDPETTAARQALVQELAPLCAFRDRLVLHSALAANDTETTVYRPDRWSSARLLEWLQRPHANSPSRPTLLALAAVGLLAFLLLSLNLLGQIAPWWLILWLPYALFTVLHLRRAENLFGEAAFLADGLRQLQAVFALLERRRFFPQKQPRLHALCAPFHEHGQRPSAQLRQLNQIVSAAATRYNPALWFILNCFTPWDLYFAHRLEQTRQTLQTLLPRWLDVWHELEAASSLAHFSYLNPDTTYPHLSTTPTEPLLRAQDIGHPLIPTNQRVHNSIIFAKLGQIFLITGSNMAGKSTFLRTLGINLCLAYAGGPVVATQLQAPFLRIYTSILVTDSLVSGFSSFYAEVRRLQAILTAVRQTDSWPLFLLIDEIFRGTNNRERLMGSRAYIQALAGSHSLAVIATHDLELAKLAETLPDMQNYHFRDAVANGRMVFDYLLRPGPCPTTNALKIMALAGLPLPDGGAGG